jgi:hypothetical protein
VKAGRKPKLRGRKMQIVVEFSGAEAAALARLGRKFFGCRHPHAGKGDLVNATAHRLLLLALRDVDRSVATWETFLNYCVAEGFTENAQKVALLHRQMESAWAASPAARELLAQR